MIKFKTKKETTLNCNHIYTLSALRRILREKHEGEGDIANIKFIDLYSTSNSLLSKIYLTFDLRVRVKGIMVGVTSFYYEVTPSEERDYLSSVTEINNIDLISQSNEFYKEGIEELNNDNN